MKQIPPMVGRTYRHYKGGEYKVITCAKHAETEQELVVYKSLAFGTVWVRPLAEWNEPVLDPHHPFREGATMIDRFSLVG